MQERYRSCASRVRRLGAEKKSTMKDLLERARDGIRTRTYVRIGGFKTAPNRPSGAPLSVGWPVIWTFRPRRPSSALQWYKMSSSPVHIACTRLPAHRSAITPRSPTGDRA
jgi:hypothetical protein